MLVTEIVANFLADKERRHATGRLTAKAIDRYRRRLSAFVADFGARVVGDCCQDDLIGWIFRHVEWESSFTRADAAGAVVACFRWAVGRRLITSQPFTRPVGCWPPLVPRVAIRSEEFAAMMRAAKRRGRARARAGFRLALQFLWETGARTCEMRALGWDAIDWRTGIATLIEHKTVAKTGEPRLVILSGLAVRILRLIHRRQRWPQTGVVFRNSWGNAWKSPAFASYFRKVAKLAGVRLGVSPYSLRHGFTVCALEAGIGERQIADLLGQATTRYVSWYGKSTRRRADYLRAVLDQVHGRK